jgi:hypothetical protein
VSAIDWKPVGAKVGGTDAEVRPTGEEPNLIENQQGKESFMGKCNADKTRRKILMGIAKKIH